MGESEVWEANETKNKTMRKRSNPQYRRLINSHRWVKLRAKKASASPLCEACLERDITTPMEEVHHIVPIESAPDFETMKLLAYDVKNLQSLCRECHKEAHRELRSNSVEEIQRRNKKRTKNFVKKFLREE